MATVTTNSTATMPITAVSMAPRAAYLLSSLLSSLGALVPHPKQGALGGDGYPALSAAPPAVF